MFNIKSEQIICHFVLARNCNPICPGVYYPRCASDRNTYANSCVMRYVTCISNGRVTLAYVGECSKYFSRLKLGHYEVIMQINSS